MLPLSTIFGELPDVYQTH